MSEHPMSSDTIRTTFGVRIRPSPIHFGLDLLQLVLELGELTTAGHQAHELLPVDLTLPERAEALPAVQDDEPVADRIRVVRVVRDEDHGHPAVARLEDVLQDDACLLHP